LKSEGVNSAYGEVNNFAAASWQEQATFWDEMMFFLY